jgi:hypothetical protein
MEKRENSQERGSIRRRGCRVKISAEQSRQGRERERKGSRWVGFKPYLDVDEGCGSGEEEEAEVAGAPSHGRPEISLVS